MAVYTYATGDDMIARYNPARLGDLVSNDGKRVTTGLTTNTNLLTALYDATSEINSAVLIGKRYYVEDLQTTADLDKGLTDTGYYLLQRLTCDLAYAYLVSRGGLSASQTDALSPRANMALQQIQMLKDGIAIFDKKVQDIPAAGVAESVPAINPQASVIHWGLPYFGLGPSTLPYGRYGGYGC